ncbi:hypothetical protein ACFZA1_02585 [Streptomyces filipinensis]
MTSADEHLDPAFLRPHGPAPPNGSAPSVGAVSYTLGDAPCTTPERA